MKITFNEAQKLGIWERICEIIGLNVYAINEGLLDSNEEITVSLNEEPK
jgi:hypothetical protein